MAAIKNIFVDLSRSNHLAMSGLAFAYLPSGSRANAAGEDDNNTTATASDKNIPRNCSDIIVAFEFCKLVARNENVAAVLRDFAPKIVGKFSEVSCDALVKDALELVHRETCKHIAFCGVHLVARDLVFTVDQGNSLRQDHPCLGSIPA